LASAKEIFRVSPGKAIAINMAQVMAGPALNDESTFAIGRSGSWVCCQLGARDHYSIPRGLHRRGLLKGLITEAWVPPTSALARLPGELGERLRERYDKGLVDANVLHCSASTFGFETRANLTRSRNIWDRIIARNNWFQSRAVQRLKALWRCGDQRSARAVFAYSYAAREILRTARDLGFTTILGQIDPGPAEERIVAEVCFRNGSPLASWQRVPNSYWDAWREECDLCDRIVVNSPWARKALIGEGVQSQKIHVVPVAYDPPDHASRVSRVYPKFGAVRPLRVLFLGSLIPRKGIYEVLEATRLLRTAPVEFRFVGASGVKSSIQVENPHVLWTGPVARKRAHCFYHDADVFILPTHSDGFGLTQLEAMAWGLPVIASKNCGEVVCHEFNGLTLSTVSAEAIVEAISWCLKNAETLSQMSHYAILTCNEFRTDHVVNKLLQCAQEGT
jgi:glycosyltransferase involved in cell wall biosynthesis